MNHTCVSCGLVFEDVGSQRDHMKTDWHRYNLKRRVAQLPPIDEQTFTSKISALSEDDKNVDKDSNKHTSKKEIRRKQREALQQQKSELLAIRKAILSKNSATDSGIDLKTTEGERDESKAVFPEGRGTATLENVESHELEEKIIAEKLANRVELSPMTCLFCLEQKKVTFENVEENVNHMFRSHGMYIPETKYLIDKEGLIRYLGEKIGLGNVCLVCNYQGRNILAVREHMQAKRHMRIPYEAEDEKLEISDFYDFSSTYDSHLKVEDNEEDEEDWEDVTSDEIDYDVDDHGGHIVDMGTELILPSGAVVGHRSLAKYFRQNLPPERILSEGQGTVIAAESRHFLSSRSKQDLAIQKRAWTREKKREDVNDRRAAKFVNNQPHFRDPLLQ